MRIGLIMHPYGEASPSGLGRSIKEIARAIIACMPEDEFTIFTKGATKEEHAFPGNNWTVKSLPASCLWLEYYLRRQERMDVYLFFTPVMPLTWTPERSVVIVHDYDYKKFTRMTLRNVLVHTFLTFVHKHTLNRANHIVVPSYATKVSVVNILSVDPNRICVIPHGTNDVCQYGSEVVSVIPKEFFLFVGAIKPRKNIERLVAAFVGFATKYKDVGLLLVGKYGDEYRERILSAVNDPLIRKHIQFLGFLPDRQLCYLYHRARALVSPSLAEGFGMTVLEAMSAGCPVITSSEGALAEVAGDTALSIDPYNSRAIQEAMEQMYDADVRKTFIARGNTRVKKYTWGRAAVEYKALLKN